MIELSQARSDQSQRSSRHAKDKEGVRYFSGLIQYLAKFIPNLSQVDAPLMAS